VLLAAAQDAEALEEEAATPEEEPNPAVVAWNAYREEHAPETMEELEALVASFLEAHSKASDDDQSDTAETGRAGWRLYV